MRVLLQVILANITEHRNTCFAIFSSFKKFTEQLNNFKQVQEPNKMKCRSHIWAHIRGRNWSAKIDDISL
jgi:hypothetical protein